MTKYECHYGTWRGTETLLTINHQVTHVICIYPRWRPWKANIMIWPQFAISNTCIGSALDIWFKRGFKIPWVCRIQQVCYWGQSNLHKSKMAAMIIQGLWSKDMFSSYIGLYPIFFISGLTGTIEISTYVINRHTSFA